MSEPASSGPDWSDRLSLTGRILAVNTLPLALLAGSFFYLDGFRERLIAERLGQAEREAQLIAGSVGAEGRGDLPRYISQLGRNDKVRIRIINDQGMVVADNWRGISPSFTLRDPELERFERQIARRLDEAIDWLVVAQVPPPFRNHERRLPSAPPGAKLSLAPDRSHMIEARAEIEGMPGYRVVTLRNARDIRRFVRAERSNLGLLLGLVSLVSVLLSLFLARTIVRPLRSLADAARQVRFGQARDVQIPTLPERHDDIGRLAQAVADMTDSLRTRMDAIESFAADVAHELKNPLASLASAVQSLQRVKRDDLRQQLTKVIANDVRRLDRLVTDVSDLSRVDAQIAWTRFEPLDLGALIGGIVKAREERKRDQVKLAFASPQSGSVMIKGNLGQLGRVVENLIDNALSFSPANGVVLVSVTRVGKRAVILVDDDGPGVPEASREAIFDRFHSDRPEEQFGQHSGLGLAIARTIVEAHEGLIRVTSRNEDGSGARFIVELPLARV